MDKGNKHIETNILDNDFALSDIISNTEVAAIVEEELLIVSAMKQNKKSKKMKGKKVTITDNKGDTDYKVIGGYMVTPNQSFGNQDKWRQPTISFGH